MPKQRLDLLLLQRGLAESQDHAARLIRSGAVRVEGHKQTKPGHHFATDSSIDLATQPRFVSRGGDKLQAALDHNAIPLHDRICLDIGASTGGFTDAMLQAGARHVYAVDTGRGQFDWTLRNRPEVTLLEATNARHLQPGDLPQQPSFAAFDVSFISLTKVLPPVLALLADAAELVTLIKPQFEARRDQVEPGGVVRDPAVHAEVQQRITDFARQQCRLHLHSIIHSPLKGPAGNIEFLAHWQRQ